MRGQSDAGADPRTSQLVIAKARPCGGMVAEAHASTGPTAKARIRRSTRPWPGCRALFGICVAGTAARLYRGDAEYGSRS